MIIGPLCTIRHMQSADLNQFIAKQIDLPSRGDYFSTLLQSPEAMRREFASTGFVTEDRELFIIEDPHGNLVGALSHFKSRTPLSREVGYRLFDRELGGRGLVTAAAGMLCDYLFLGYQQINRLELLMDPANTASERVAQKCGFSYEGTLREAFFTAGRLRDAKIYSLLRSEWDARRAADLLRTAQ